MLTYYKTLIFLALTSDSPLLIVTLVNEDVLLSAVYCIFPKYVNETLALSFSLMLQLRWLCKCLEFG